MAKKASYDPTPRAHKHELMLFHLHDSERTDIYICFSCKRLYMLTEIPKDIKLTSVKTLNEMKRFVDEMDMKQLEGAEYICRVLHTSPRFKGAALETLEDMLRTLMKTMNERQIAENGETVV